MKTEGNIQYWTNILSLESEFLIWWSWQREQALTKDVEHD